MKAIHTTKAPQAIGTYSQAIAQGGCAYISGQIPLDPQSMQLIEGDIEVQIRQVFDNLSQVALVAGSELKNTVKLTVYLLNMDHFQCVNEVMAEYFGEPYPARAAVGVSALPKGAQVEVDAIVAIPE